MEHQCGWLHTNNRSVEIHWILLLLTDMMSFMDGRACMCRCCVVLLCGITDICDIRAADTSGIIGLILTDHQCGPDEGCQWHEAASTSWSHDNNQTVFVPLVNMKDLWATHIKLRIYSEGNERMWRLTASSGSENRIVQVQNALVRGMCMCTSCSVGCQVSWPLCPFWSSSLWGPGPQCLLYGSSSVKQTDHYIAAPPPAAVVFSCVTDRWGTRRGKERYLEVLMSWADSRSRAPFWCLMQIHAHKRSVWHFGERQICVSEPDVSWKDVPIFWFIS